MTITRRNFVRATALGAAAAAILPTGVSARAVTPTSRPIPSSGERIPAVGLGTWITFNVGDDLVLQADVRRSWRRSSPAAGA